MTKNNLMNVKNFEIGKTYQSTHQNEMGYGLITVIKRIEKINKTYIFDEQNKRYTVKKDLLGTEYINVNNSNITYPVSITVNDIV